MNTVLQQSPGLDRNLKTGKDNLPVTRSPLPFVRIHSTTVIAWLINNRFLSVVNERQN